MEFVRDLPKTATGKIQRKVLKNKEWARVWQGQEWSGKRGEKYSLACTNHNTSNMARVYGPELLETLGKTSYGRKRRKHSYGLRICGIGTTFAIDLQIFRRKCKEFKVWNVRKDSPKCIQRSNFFNCNLYKHFPYKKKKKVTTTLRYMQIKEKLIKIIFVLWWVSAVHWYILSKNYHCNILKFFQSGRKKTFLFNASLHLDEFVIL